MTNYFICIVMLIVTMTNAIAQNPSLSLKQKKYKTSEEIVISGEVGYLSVPENRTNPDSRTIKIKYIRLKSLSENPKEPVIYLEGGGSACTWQAENPKYLNDWIDILEISDLIFIDQRGTADRKLIHIQKNGYPENFFVSEHAATTYYQSFSEEALEAFEKKGLDVQGYTIEAHAEDVNALVEALEIDAYSIFGFSFGTSIGMALMKLHEDKITNAVLVSADGPHQSFNYPSYLDSHFKKIAEMVSQNEEISQVIPDLNVLLKQVMEKLENKPTVVSVKHPLNKKSLDVKVGAYGLGLILRLDIDDVNDIPVIPRLLYGIDQGDYSLLQWFVQKRIRYALGLPGNGINQGIASGVSPERLKRIQDEAETSPFGNVVNFPFGAAVSVWPQTTLSFDTSTPLTTAVRTLFITGDLDCRTPVQQVNELAKGFSNVTHLVVRNAGHEQAMWDSDIWSGAIPQFLKGADVSGIDAYYSNIKFLPLTGPAKSHPSLE
ncbi:MAG: alpha/beta fold hydrolase [Ekhidna sp.]